MNRAAAALPEIIFHFSDGCPGGRDETCADRANFRRVSYVSYDRYLSKYDLVVRHGGTGVLHWCLQHGKPAVVFPVDFDPFDCAARLLHAGLAKRLPTLWDLAATMAAALADEPLWLRCEAFRRMVATTAPAAERIAGMVRARLSR